MKIAVNDELFFELNDTQKNIIKNDIHADEFDEDMKRRISYILTHKLERCFDRLKREWEPKLIAEGAKSFPTDPEEFAKLVFAHPEYKCRKTRDCQSSALKEAARGVQSPESVV